MTCKYFHFPFLLTKHKGTRPDTLQKALVDVWSNQKCQKSFQDQKKSHVINRTQMCAGKTTGGVDSCWVSNNFILSIVFSPRQGKIACNHVIEMSTGRLRWSISVKRKRFNRCRVDWNRMWTERFTGNIYARNGVQRLD